VPLIGSICADESSAKPMMIIPRDTVDIDLTLCGVSDRNCHICHQAHGFIDRELFEDWFGEIFIPEIEQRRKATHYSGPSVLILDGCSAHDGDFFLDLCIEHNVVPFPSPPHPSNQVQPLDLGVFGVAKHLMTRLNRMDEANVQSVHIARLFSAFHSACNAVNVIESFRNPGIALHLDDGMLMCHVDLEECRCLLGQFDHISTGAQEDAADPPGEMNESDEANVPLWVQILDEEAALLLDEAQG
jgi:hypothetical protein